MQPSHPVPRTRITIPHRRKDWLRRERLHALLDELIDKRLTIIAAPAGYGKTTVLLDYTAQSNLPVCWYSINALDSEPHRFINNLVEAVALRFPEFGHQTRAVLQSGQTAVDNEFIAAVLVNDLYEHITEHFILILDDYHFVNENSGIRAFMNRLIQDVDENCHILITSRTLVSFPALPMMIARSEVGGISYEELEFSTDEIRRLFLAQQNQAISDEKASDIYERTEGWITGILLTAQVNPQSVENQSRLTRVSGSSLDAYFKQLLLQQPDDLRLFLQRSSLLEEFNAEHCRAIIGGALNLPETDWLVLLDQVQANNLFSLPVGDSGEWVRYHYLFLDYLQANMWRERPAEAQAISSALAEHYLNERQWDHAYALYRALNQTDQLVRLIERAGSDLLVDSRIATLSAWIDTLPIDVSSTQAYIIALQGAIAATTGNTSLALTLYNQAVNAMALPGDRRKLARALIWRAASYRQIGNLNASIADAREVIGLAEDDLELRIIHAEALRTIGICTRMQGKLHEAANWLTQALNMALSAQDRRNEAIIRNELGSLYENLGNYAQASEMFSAAIKYWKQLDNAYWLSNLLNNLAVIQQMMGNYQEAFNSLEKALAYARTSSNVRLEAFILAGIADIYAELDAVEEAQTAYQQARAIARQVRENFLLVYMDVQESSLASANGEFENAYRMLQNARTIALADGSDMESFLCDLEYGGVKIREGKAEDGLLAIEKALGFFESQGHKAQVEKAYLYLMIASGQVGHYELMFSHLMRVLTFLGGNYPANSLIATASRFFDTLTRLNEVELIGGQMDDLFHHIESFREQIPGLRRFLRQHAISVPFAPPTYSIRALGKMQVRVNNRLISSSDWQTQIARNLFFKLLAQPEGMTKEEIGLIFWPDASPEDVKFRIKNTLYRVRHALGKEVILLDQEMYRFNNNLDYDYDVEVFLRENALAQKSKDPLQKLAHLREAVKQYKGPFLVEVTDTWAIAPREAMQQNYLNILLQVSELYLGMANYDLALDYCQRALSEDNCLEAAYRLSLRIYAAMGNRAALVRQYQRCVEVLHREINTEPSPQTQSLYQELVK